MERLKTTILLVLLITVTPTIFAQKKDSKQEFNNLLKANPETLFLHCNTTEFVTGETLLYKLYSLNPFVFATSPVSKIAYVELIGEDLKRIFIQKLSLENGIAQGDFFVPATLKTGNYKLIAYTNWMLNKPVTELYQLDLSIINPFQKNETEVKTVVKGLPAFTKNIKTKNTTKDFSTLENKKTVKNTTKNIPVLEKDTPINNTKATPNMASKIAYVELIGEDSKSIFTQKLSLEKGIAEGKFFIPANIQTGNYKLIINTNLMANKPATEPFHADLPAPNQYQKNERVVNGTTKDLASIEEVKNTEKEFPTLEEENPINKNNKLTDRVSENHIFSLLLDKKKVEKREKFTFKINTTTQQIQKGNYSISVRKVDQLSTEKQLTTTEFKNKWLKKDTNYESAEKEIILPELRGELITGSITAKNGSSTIQSKTVALSIPGKSYTFKTTNTDASGKFIFDLDKINAESNLIVQVMDEDREKYIIQLDEPKGVAYSSLNFKANFDLSPDMKSSILKRSVASQIENAYYYKKKDSLLVLNTTDNFFDGFEKEYILDDYTRFPTLQETITEVLFEVYYKQKENDFIIGIRDYNANFETPGSALVLVDGLLILDNKELFKYNTKKIFKVSIISGGYYYGSKLFNGIISFTTFKQDYINNQSGSYIKNIKILRPAVKKEYFTPDYTDKAKNKRIPDYRYQLLWLPELTLANTENPVSFYTSDVPGTFEITLEGFTDQGIPVSLKDTFKVQ